MFGVYGNSDQYLKFSKESVTDFNHFIRELAGFSDRLTEACASACVQLPLENSENQEFNWYDFSGPEWELLNTIGPMDLIESTIEHALANGREVCLYYSSETGEVSESPPVSAASSISSDHSAGGASNPVTMIDSNSPQNEIDHFEESQSFGSFEVTTSVSTETEHETFVSTEQQNDAALDTSEAENQLRFWIRPLAAEIAVVSLCPAAPSETRLINVIRNAHAARELCVQKATAENKNAEIRKIVQLANGVSESLPLSEQAYLQVNEIRRYLDCDRVTIFDVNNASATTLAVSGQPKFNRRSNSIRTGQTMVGRIAKTGEPFWFSGNFEELADSVKEDVRRYTDESLVNSFVLFPLIKQHVPVYPSEEELMQEAISPGAASKHKTIGAVLVEQIEDVIEKPKIEDRWNDIKTITVNQFHNSRRYDSIFMLRLWTKLGRFAAFYRGQTRRKAIAITAAIVTLLLAALLIPADFKIRCEGYLVIEDTKDLYTMAEGNVVALNAVDGKAVKKGDCLLVQENLNLSNESIKLAGQIEELEVEIEETNNSRIELLLSGDSNSGANADSLAQKIRQMDQELHDLKTQSKLMAQEMEQLKVCAPFAGTISGWKAERRLLGRPLEKGVHLFSLIPNSESSKFKLELRVPDQRAGYVQEAWLKAKENDTQLPVVFRLASAPGADHHAVVSFVSPGLERDEHIGYTLPIDAVTSDEIPISQRKSRTAVTAKVICGRRSFAYCKGYEALDWFKGKMFEFIY